MKDFAVFVTFMAVVICVMTACENSDWKKSIDASAARQDALDSQPHAIREADGCKVYTWKQDRRWHLFTRCGPLETVRADRSYIESCGKNCRKERSEVVVTQP